jgi:hypothetical protein
MDISSAGTAAQLELSAAAAAAEFIMAKTTYRLMIQMQCRWRLSQGVE